MHDTLFSSINSALEDHQINGIPKGVNEIHPNYTGYSIANLPASICRWLDAPPALDNPLADTILSRLQPSYQHIILVLVDGLRLDFFRRFALESIEQGMHREWGGIFQDGLLTPLTSMAPSTTSAALTTLWTGRLPAEHGVIGYELFLKEFGVTANMIFHSVASFIGDTGSLYRSGFDPEAFLPVPTLGALFNTHGVKSFAFQHASISSSGLSQMLLQGATSVPYERPEDLWPSVEKALNDHHNGRTYSYIYWSGLDTTAHHHGPSSAKVYAEWLAFARPLAGFLQKLRAKGEEDTLFILTADHGQIAAEIRPDYDLHNHPDFVRHLILMPTGESRLPYLFIKSGHEQEVSVYLENHWEGQFSMMLSEQALSAGLLGPAIPNGATIDRMGSHLVIPRGSAYWWWVNKENHLLGRHGGLSREEMLVPFFTLER